MLSFSFSFITERLFIITMTHFYLQNFDANTDASSVVTISFPSPRAGRYVQISPVSCPARCALRMEVIGCLGNDGGYNVKSHNIHSLFDGVWVGTGC